MGLPWYAQLALKLLHERSLGPASRFADYLPALPASAAAVDLPATWPTQAVRALQYPYLEEQVRRASACTVLKSPGKGPSLCM